MNTKILQKILSHHLDSGVSIVTCNNNEAHIVCTWVSYVKLINNDTLYIPVGGMVKTEENLKNNSKVILSISNREIQGKMYNGTGLNIVGIGEIIRSGDVFDTMKKDFDWIRGVLKITMTEIEQTL